MAMELIDFESWYLWLADWRLNALNRFGVLFEASVAEETRAFEATVEQEAARIQEPARRMEFFEWHSDQRHVYSTTLPALGREAVIIRGFFILETELVDICHTLARRTDNPFAVATHGGQVGNVLSYLSRQSITLSEADERNLQALRRLRNAIAHRDGVVDDSDVEVLRESALIHVLTFEGRRIRATAPVHDVVCGVARRILESIAVQYGKGAA